MSPMNPLFPRVPACQPLSPGTNATGVMESEARGQQQVLADKQHPMIDSDKLKVRSN